MQFGLTDSKYDEKIELLDREDNTEAKYAKALEISGGEEKLTHFAGLSALAACQVASNLLPGFTKKAHNPGIPRALPLRTKAAEPVRLQFARGAARSHHCCRRTCHPPL